MKRRTTATTQNRSDSRLSFAPTPTPAAAGTARPSSSAYFNAHTTKGERYELQTNLSRRHRSSAPRVPSAATGRTGHCSGSVGDSGAALAASRSAPACTDHSGHKLGGSAPSNSPNNRVNRSKPMRLAALKAAAPSWIWRTRLRAPVITSSERTANRPHCTWGVCHVSRNRFRVASLASGRSNRNKQSSRQPASPISGQNRMAFPLSPLNLAKRRGGVHV